MNRRTLEEKLKNSLYEKLKDWWEKDGGREQVLKGIREKLSSENLSNNNDFVKNKIKIINVGKEIPVPYQHVYLNTSNGLLFQIWHFKQDIVFYEKLFGLPLNQNQKRENKLKCSELNIDISIEKAKGATETGLPFVIIEVKNKQPITHILLAYKQKAELIKLVFPYCKYIFLIFDKIAPRTYRHGWVFDEIVEMDQNINNINKLYDVISKLMVDAIIKMLKMC